MATSGRVLYGKAPGNIYYRALMLVGGTALGAFVLVDGLALAPASIAPVRAATTAATWCCCGCR